MSALAEVLAAQVAVLERRRGLITDADMADHYAASLATAIERHIAAVLDECRDDVAVDIGIRHMESGQLHPRGEADAALAVVRERLIGGGS